jgi:hypothetical protein
MESFTGSEIAADKNLELSLQGSAAFGSGRAEKGDFRASERSVLKVREHRSAEKRALQAGMDQMPLNPKQKRSRRVAPSGPSAFAGGTPGGAAPCGTAPIRNQ